MIATHPHLADALMDFPQRLVQHRKTKKLTQQALADLAGIHITQVQRYEKGDAQPTLDMIRKLSLALAVSADTLLFDEDERGPDDTLRLQFEALQQFDEEERQTAQAVLEGLILKHQAKQSQLRMQQPARSNEKKRATR